MITSPAKCPILSSSVASSPSSQVVSIQSGKCKKCLHSSAWSSRHFVTQVFRFCSHCFEAHALAFSVYKYEAPSHQSSCLLRAYSVQITLALSRPIPSVLITLKIKSCTLPHQSISFRIILSARTPLSQDACLRKQQSFPSRVCHSITCWFCSWW